MVQGSCFLCERTRETFKSYIARQTPSYKSYKDALPRRCEGNQTVMQLCAWPQYLGCSRSGTAGRSRAAKTQSSRAHSHLRVADHQRLHEAILMQRDYLKESVNPAMQIYGQLCNNEITPRTEEAPLRQSSFRGIRTEWRLHRMARPGPFPVLRRWCVALHSSRCPLRKARGTAA